MITESAAKKDTQKLQRAIVDGLEDVKAQDIQVFNTEHLSPLFERVIIASGTSNRQTKALAASVRDAVREAGFSKPRVEGEDNGEWIIVDCGAAVAHIMQPAIRQYYNLEEIWGDKPVRLKGAATAKKKEASAGADKAQVATKKVAKTTAKSPTTAKAAPAKRAAAKSTGATSAPRSPAAKSAAAKTGARKTAAKTAAKTPARKNVPLRTLVVNQPPAVPKGKPAAKDAAKMAEKVVQKATRKPAPRKPA